MMLGIGLCVPIGDFMKHIYYIKQQSLIFNLKTKAVKAIGIYTAQLPPKTPDKHRPYSYLK
jgi:hypothetical protein